MSPIFIQRLFIPLQKMYNAKLIIIHKEFLSYNAYLTELKLIIPLHHTWWRIPKISRPSSGFTKQRCDYGRLASNETKLNLFLRQILGVNKLR